MDNIFKDLRLGEDFINVYSTFMHSITNLKPSEPKPQRLELRPIEFCESYIKKWNINVRDNYCYLFVDGVKKSDNIYRLGGMSNLKDGREYYMILKYLEEEYSDEIMEMSTRGQKKSKKEIAQQRKHLGSHWAIIDKEGNEKKVFDDRGLDYPYLIDGSRIYNYKDEYINIETGMVYCNSYSSAITSKDYIFVESNGYKVEKSERGIFQINKLDGSFVFFPK